MFKFMSLVTTLLLSAQVAVAGPAPRVKRPPSPIVKQTETVRDGDSTGHRKTVETLQANGTKTTAEYLVWNAGVFGPQTPTEPVLTRTMKSWALKYGVTKAWSGYPADGKGKTRTELKSGISRIDGFSAGKKSMEIRVPFHVRGHLQAMAEFAAKQPAPFHADIDDRAGTYSSALTPRPIILIQIHPGDTAQVIADKIDVASMSTFGRPQPRN